MRLFNRRLLTALLLAILLSLGRSPIAHAATNAATGGIGGLDNGTLIGGDGTGTARIEINSTRLRLVKQARTTDGTVLAPNADVAAGSEVVFVLYVDNTTDFDATDLRWIDALNESEFSYVAGTLEMTNVASGADDATIWSGTWTALSDAVGGPDDEASAVDTNADGSADRIAAGRDPTQTNRPLVAPANRLIAIRFRVTVN